MTWTPDMYAWLLALDGRDGRPRPGGLAALSAVFPNRGAALDALAALDRRRRWTEREDALLRRSYSRAPTADLAALLRRSRKSVYVRAVGLGYSKDPSVLRQNGARLAAAGRATRFSRGHVPWNKGSHYRAGGRSAETRFKRGTRSGAAALNWMPVGSERWVTDGSGGHGYLYRKVADRPNALWANWRPVHHLLWEEHHGPVPRGRLVAFRNGDRSDVRIENLELITRAENARRNRMWTQYPRVLAEVIHLRGQLQRAIRRKAGREEECRAAIR